MYIISQNKKHIVLFNPENERFETRPIFNERDGSLKGVNLFCKDINIGTFPTLIEAIIEMQDIRGNNQEYYKVRSYEQFCKSGLNKFINKFN